MKHMMIEFHESQLQAHEYPHHELINMVKNMKHNIINLANLMNKIMHEHHEWQS